MIVRIDTYLNEPIANELASQEQNGRTYGRTKRTNMEKIRDKNESKTNIHDIRTRQNVIKDESAQISIFVLSVYRRV